MRDLTAVLASADLADKAEIYGQLGLALTYHPLAPTVKKGSHTCGIYVRKPVSEGGPTPYPHIAL
jgi:hypothetical protein